MIEQQQFDPNVPQPVAYDANGQPVYAQPVAQPAPQPGAPIQPVQQQQAPPAANGDATESLDVEGLAVLNAMPVEEVAEDADASDSPPPIPPGYYPAKVVLDSVSKVKYTKNRSPFVTLKVLTVINAPEEWFHGAQRAYYATTLIRNTNKGKTSAADDLIKALQGQKVQGSTGQKVQMLQQLLQSDRDIGIEVDWEAAAMATDEERNADPRVYPPNFYKSASRFPTNMAGQPMTVDITPDGKKPANTRDTIRRVVDLNTAMTHYAAQKQARLVADQVMQAQQQGQTLQAQPVAYAPQPIPQG